MRFRLLFQNIQLVLLALAPVNAITMRSTADFLGESAFFDWLTSVEPAREVIAL